MTIKNLFCISVPTIAINIVYLLPNLFIFYLYITLNIAQVQLNTIFIKVEGINIFSNKLRLIKFSLIPIYKLIENSKLNIGKIRPNKL